MKKKPHITCNGVFLRLALICAPLWFMPLAAAANPVVQITNPANSTTNWACRQFYIAATATAQGGVITNFEFFLGSTNGPLLGTRSANATKATAWLPWTSMAVGSNYVFVVRATASWPPTGPSR